MPIRFARHTHSSLRHSLNHTQEEEELSQVQDEIPSTFRPGVGAASATF